MQDVFARDGHLCRALKDSLSRARFARYREAADGNDVRAIALYGWNLRLSQALYAYLQAWEICLRNRTNGFLCARYGQAWPYDDRRARRQMTRMDQVRVQNAIARQERIRGLVPAPLPSIVADLSAGFWVSQLSRSYDVPYAWRRNLPLVFPHDPSLDARTAWEICNALLNLRNRIAHHEPVLHLPLAQHHRALRRIVAAMCPGTFAFAEASCTFGDVHSTKP